MAFFETPRFPDDISYGSRSTAGYKTDIIDKSGGAESRLIRWANSRRSFDAAFGVRTIPQFEVLLAFFHSCKGRAHGFRFKDPLDDRSSQLNTPIAASDQILAASTATTYQLRKRYNSGATVYRDIKKPVVNSVLIAVDGVPTVTGFAVDYTTGIITFSSAPGGVVSAGFEFDTPCRFDTDELSATAFDFNASSLDVPIVEIKL